MSYQRIERISEEVRREVDRIIRDEVSDPRVTGTFSITRAEVTRDLRYAKIYVSADEGAEERGGLCPPRAWQADGHPLCAGNPVRQ